MPYRVLVALAISLAMSAGSVRGAQPYKVLVPRATGFPLAGPTVQGALESSGFQFTYITEPLSESALSGFDILVFHDNRYVDDDPTAAEVAAIESFLTAGNGLLVVGERDHFGPSNLTHHADYLGIGSAGGSYFESVTDIDSHPSLAGISSIDVYGGVGLSVSDPDTVIARYADDSPYAAAGGFGNGRWFVSGDEVWLSEDFGNVELAQSVFTWLAPVPEPSSIALLSAGLVGGLVCWRCRKRRTSRP